MLPQALRDVYRETAMPAAFAYAISIERVTSIVHAAPQATRPQTPWSLDFKNATGGWKAA